MPYSVKFNTSDMVTTFINAATSIYTSAQSRKQQEELAKKSRELTQRIELNRQDFQLELSEKNAKIQRELNLQNHELRIREQQANFEEMCRQAEWTKFLDTWPLVNSPSVIRAEQVLPDRTVSLRVIFAKSNNQIFSNVVYPKVEQGLRDFVDIYHNEFKSKNIIFYHNAFVSNLSGGAVDTNIHYALKELPVIIIDTNVLLDEICVSFTMWGLGSNEQSHFTVFRIPYQQKMENGNIVFNYYSDLSIKILAYLKFVLGYAYDTYNLIQYDKVPLLPKVAAYESQQEVAGCLLEESEVRQIIGQKYGEIYASVIGIGEKDDKKPYAALPESCKQSILHKLRLGYAEAVKDYISEAEYVKYLNESVEAWVRLHSLKPTGVFLPDVINGFLIGSKDVLRFFSVSDAEYFKELEQAYASVPRRSEIYKYIAEIKKQICCIPLMNRQNAGGKSLLQDYNPEKCAGKELIKF